MRFRITLSRVRREYLSVEVDADDECEARRRALAEGRESDEWCDSTSNRQRVESVEVKD